MNLQPEMAQSPAARLRADFDRSFTLPPPAAVAPARDYVIVESVGELFALRANTLRGIESKVPLVAVPSSEPALLGVAGVRGQIIPVFSLATLLGQAPGPVPQGELATFALVPHPDQFNQDQLIGLGFEHVVQFVRVSEENFFAGDDSASPPRRASISHENELHLVVDPETLLQSILGGSMGL